jgi:hypothetical protein
MPIETYRDSSELIDPYRVLSKLIGTYRYSLRLIGTHQNSSILIEFYRNLSSFIKKLGHETMHKTELSALVLIRCLRPIRLHMVFFPVYQLGERHEFIAFFFQILNHGIKRLRCIFGSVVA